MKNRLIPLAQQIAENSYTEHPVKEGTALGKIYEEYLSTSPVFKSSDWTEEDKLKGGIALSSNHAHACIYDHQRTVAFLKGAHDAIQELLIRFPEEKVTILYAGCGPLGPILIPLLPLFSKDRIEVILLDYHKSSIDSIRHLISSLELDEYILEYVVGNAITYQKPIGTKLHMVLTETMQAALVVEPQVAISLNLIPQLEPNGIIVPEMIDIELACANYNKLPFLRQRADHCILTNTQFSESNNQIILGSALTINKNAVIAHQGTRSYSFKSNWHLDKIDTELHPDLCLFTTLTVFRHTTLKMSESMITNPYCLTNLWRNSFTTQIQLTFNYESIPRWSVD